jgi:hypothetical protein
MLLNKFHLSFLYLNFLFEKKCPEGKILNPKTCRFIIDRECPKGSYLKPSTQRCNKIETSSKIRIKILVQKKEDLLIINVLVISKSLN